VELLASLAFGILHGLEPDHLAAMSALAIRGAGASRRALVGLQFGLGHVAVLLVAGGAALGLQIAMPAGLERGAEIASGAILVALGIWVLASRHPRLYVHEHEHAHGDAKVHAHPHVHREGKEHDHGHLGLVLGGLFAVGGLRSVLLVGLPAVNAGSTERALLAVALFGVGIFASMTAAGLVLARAARYVCARGERPFRWGTIGVGILSVGVGTAWAVRSLPV
jgi:ABC-type nickel/cobalt efflux system permease component RcnA